MDDFLMGLPEPILFFAGVAVAVILCVVCLNYSFFRVSLPCFPFLLRGEGGRRVGERERGKRREEGEGRGGRGGGKEREGVCINTL